MPPYLSGVPGGGDAVTAGRATDAGPALKGDLNLVLKGLRLRGPKGPQGTLRMSRRRRQDYGKEVGGHLRLALDRAGLAAAPAEYKELRVTVVHKGVFDPDSLRASVEPLLGALKPRVVKCEVFQEQGAPSVRVEAWSPALAAEFKGRTVEV